MAISHDLLPVSQLRIDCLDGDERWMEITIDFGFEHVGRECSANWKLNDVTPNWSLRASEWFSVFINKFMLSNTNCCLKKIQYNLSIMRSGVSQTIYDPQMYMVF